MKNKELTAAYSSFMEIPETVSLKRFWQSLLRADKSMGEDELFTNSKNTLNRIKSPSYIKSLHS